jgi:UDP-N-acetylglucosamine--N-acetylmuramyl-(pentapeptide) pyrophosphoryl-undecaprenol N-acetylglucosamine transferase
MSKGRRRVLFAGGGTGGHVFPGVALARHFDPDAVFWLCTTRPFDVTQMEREKIPFDPLPSPRWSRLTGFLSPMRTALVRASRKLREFRPDFVVGVGGYGMVPPLVAAVAHGIPYVLLEQNVRPGKANRMLAPGAARVYVQWEEARGAFPGCGSRVVATGSPVRESLRRVDPAEARRHFGLEPGLPTLVVVGGSQGADLLNRAVPQSLGEATPKLQVLHVAGWGRAEAVRADYEGRGARAVVLEFVGEMEYLYSAADLVISRAGAMAIAEMALLEVPAVLVPITRSARDHQAANARAAAGKGGAIHMTERTCLAGGLEPVLRGLVSGDGSIDAMRGGMRRLARPDAARVILEDLERVA